MQRLIWVVFIAAAASSSVLAATTACVATPEIDANTGIAALSLLAGATLVIRGRRKK